MTFRTEIKLQRSVLDIGHGSKIFMAGSCFSENICRKLSEAHLDVCGNPFGVLFNPASIASMLEALAAGRTFNAEDLQSGGGLWFSWDHHGSFSRPDAEEALSAINDASVLGAKALRQSYTVIITFGTAWVYRLVESGKTVANCHKAPSSMFVRERMSVEEIVGLYEPLLEGVLSDKRVVFTVSPVRHLKDGFEKNSLSKAILRVAVEQMVSKWNNVSYFPAFEIMNDDLRDYRFYGEDMVHPSPVAVDYIWDKFSSWALSSKSLELLPKLEKLSVAMKHRIMNPASGETAAFARNMLSLIEELSAQLPETDFGPEREYFSVIGLESV